MKRALFMTCRMLACVTSATALACSCNRVEVLEALQHSTTVVVARISSTHQAPMPDDPNGRYVVEYGFFEVIEIIKGSRKVGDRIQIRSEIGPGLCGRSARNSPVWLEEAPAPASSLPNAFPVSDTWLVFGDGNEPYELSLCSRSSPMNVRGADDLEIVQKYIKQSQEQHEP